MASFLILFKKQVKKNKITVFIQMSTQPYQIYLAASALMRPDIVNVRYHVKLVMAHFTLNK